MRLPERPFLPIGQVTEYDRRLSVTLQDLLGRAFVAVNTLSAAVDELEGSIGPVSPGGSSYDAYSYTFFGGF